MFFALPALQDIICMAVIVRHALVLVMSALMQPIAQNAVRIIRSRSLHAMPALRGHLSDARILQILIRRIVWIFVLVCACWELTLILLCPAVCAIHNVRPV